MEDKKPEVEKLPAEVRANYLSSETSIFFNVAMFEQAQRIATMFAESTMVPEHFRGNVGNCMIALNYASRLQADPFMLMQCMYIVHGKPGIEGKLVEAIINQSGKYADPLEYEWLDPEDKIITRLNVLKAAVPSEYGCQAFTVDKKSGKRVTGPKITWQLVKGNGWYDNKGPDKTVESNKWRTMPEMMFYYRCASWFSNKNCPELKLGMHTVEELQEIVDLRKEANGSFVMKSAADKLKPINPDIYKTQDILEEKKESDEPPTKEEAEDPTFKFTSLKPRAFKKLLNDNMEAIPGMAPEHQDVIKAEWKKHFSGQPFPVLLASDKAPEDKPKTELSLEEREAAILKFVEGAEKNDTLGVLVPCPNREEGDLIRVERCDLPVCMYKERVGCPTWVEFDKAG